MIHFSLALVCMQMVGKLNYDVWKFATGYLVDDLRIKRDFPNNPDVRHTWRNGSLGHQ